MKLEAAHNNLDFLSIEEAADLLKSRKVSPVELTRHAFARMERLNPLLNCFLTTNFERAIEQASRAEKEILHGGPKSKLHGIPISLKDNFDTAGLRTTAGSLILKDHIPVRDSDVAARLNQAGAILLGKTNMHEFAYGITNENPHYGATHNPWNVECITGGSSGGSAAAVSSGIGYASMGTDTGGSIRIPASLCGVVGLKPTFNLVSVRGTVPLAKSFDHAGPLGRRVSDVRIVIEAIARDRRPPAPGSASREKRGAIRLGWPRNFYFDFLDGEVRELLDGAARSFALLGAEIHEVHLPHLAGSIDAATRISLAEATAYHRTQGYYPQRAGEYGEDVRARLELGDSVGAVEYIQGLTFKRRLAADFDSAFEQVDAILAPAAPAAAPRSGMTEIALAGNAESLRSAMMRITRPANFTGHPALSIPCGFTREGLPAGLQLIGARSSEYRLLEIAALYEEASEWHKRRPPLD